MRNIQTAVSPHSLKIGHVNLFTHYSPYYHLLKYLVFLLKHPVHILIDLILFIPCIIDNRFTTLTNKMHKIVPEIFILQYHTEQNETVHICPQLT